jgi:hypothetical protein
MTSADQYRKLAAELRAAAAGTANRSVAAQLLQLARSYIRLAEQADKNSLADVSIEVGKKPPQEDEGT